MPFTEFYCNPSVGDNRNAGSSESSAVFVDTGTYTNASRTFVCSVTPTGFAVGDFVSICQTTKTLATDMPNIIARVTSITGNSVVLDATAILTFTAIGDGAAILRAKGHWLGMTTTNSFPLANVTGVLRNAASDIVRVNFKNNVNYNLVTTAISTNNSTLQMHWSGYENVPGDDGMAVFQRVSPTDTITCHASSVAMRMSNIYFLNVTPNFATNAAALTVSGSNCIFVRCCIVGSNMSGVISVGTNNILKECFVGNFNTSNTLDQYGFRVTGAGSQLFNCTSIGGSQSNSYCLSVSGGAFVEKCLAISNNAFAGIHFSTADYINKTTSIGSANAFYATSSGRAVLNGCIAMNASVCGFATPTSGYTISISCIAHNCNTVHVGLNDSDIYIANTAPVLVKEDGSIELALPELVGYQENKLWSSDINMMTSEEDPFPIQKRKRKIPRSRKASQGYGVV